MLSLATTDMDIEITEAIAADVEKAGNNSSCSHICTILSAKCRSFKVTIELDPSGNFITVRAGRSDFRLSSLPVSDFPQFGGGDYPTTFSTRAADMRALIDRTKFAMSTKKPVIT